MPVSSCALFYETNIDINDLQFSYHKGLVISWIGNPLILKPETMHSVWSTIEWIGNTLLFLIAGIILGSIEYKITSTDVVSVIVVYLLLQVIRAVMLCAMYPALANLGIVKLYLVLNIQFIASLL